MVNPTVYTYIVSLPPGIKEAVLTCCDGYTIYISDQLDEIQRMQSWKHAMKHIAEDDFEAQSVQRIEKQAHK